MSVALGLKKNRMEDGSNSPAAMYMEAEDYDPDKCYFESTCYLI